MVCGCVASVGGVVISSGRVRIGSGLVRIPFAIIIFARGVGRIWARLAVRLGEGRWWNLSDESAYGCGRCEDGLFAIHVYLLSQCQYKIISFILQQCQYASQTIYIQPCYINPTFH